MHFNERLATLLAGRTWMVLLSREAHHCITFGRMRCRIGMTIQVFLALVPSIVVTVLHRLWAAIISARMHSIATVASCGTKVLIPVSVRLVAKVKQEHGCHGSSRLSIIAFVTNFSFTFAEMNRLR